MEGKKQVSQPLKKMIPQLLISVSLFSFLLSYSSLLYSSSSSLSLSPKLHHYFNKNCLFLICNALLVFLAKTSGFIQPPTTHDLNDMLQITPLHKFVMEEEAHGGKISADAGPKEVSIFIAESEEEDHEEEEEDQGEAAVHKLDDHETQPISPTTCWLFHDDDEQLYGQEGGEDEDEDEDEDEEEEEEEEMMSTEELNRKFEDFIRKMKEEIIINEAARQKVIMLNWPTYL